GDDNLINLILVAWILLFMSQVGLDFIRHFILFHIGSKVNIRLLTDFMMKILRLPVRFFQSRMPDDVMQTLYENPRLQRFLTNEALSSIFAGSLILFFSLVLLAFNWKIFGVFLLATCLQGFFVWASLRNRKNLNSTRHEYAAGHFSKLTDLIRGIKDIKINGAERTQRWVWERSEAKLYAVGKQHIVSNDLLRNVPLYLGELRNIFIIYIGAKAVLGSGMTVGVLVAVIFILSQLTNPLKTIIEFFLGWQEARSTLEQMNEIHRLQSDGAEGTVDVLPETGDLEGINISFRYDTSSATPWILRNVDFKIQQGKTTAIVGPSGSGKTTLLHLLLNFYQTEDGILKIGDLRLSDIRSNTWLEKCGVVHQDGHIFHDTIARNIALGDHIVDNQRLLEAARIANILPFMERMRLGFNTVVGDGGLGLSKGQRQGILIARAVYKNPDYLFLDEATNDLDADNERIVLRNLQEAFRGRTIILIASRMELPIRIDQHIPLAPPKIKKEANGALAAALGGNRNGIPENFNGKVLSN
ncbi:MAG: ATP-binding cassette domain-containing protein, partial [Bacteroidota bacterium]